MKKIVSIALIVCFSVAFLPMVTANGVNNRAYGAIALGYGHSATLRTDGSLWTWGFNCSGQLGDGTIENKIVPTKIMDNVSEVFLGWTNSAAIKTDGTLWTWGNNVIGELGDGTKTDKHIPVKVMDNVLSVSLGGNHTASVKKDNTLWMWGSNRFGQLGDGTIENREIPIKIMDNVSTVSLCDANSAVIKTDGTLWTWGYNEYGQLGNGTTNTSYTPVKIMSDVAMVSLGYFSGSAVKTDGTLWTWGYNEYGQLGDGTTKNRYTPVKVMSGVSDVSFGGSHGAAIKTDGTLWTWGNNEYGQLGDGTTEERHTPVKIMENVSAVTLGYSNGAAVKNDGSLWVWGGNEYGQLGDGTKKNNYTPVKIMDNVMLQKEGALIDSGSNNDAEGNEPKVSDTTAQTITLNDEITLTAWIDGIYSKVFENDFAVKSSDENIIKILEFNADCGGISDVYDETDITYLTSVDTSIKGINQGTASLVYYYQGNEIGRIDVAVEATIAETVSDETILKATVLHNNNAFHYYKDTAASPSILIHNQIKAGYTKGLANAYLLVDDLLSVLTLHFENGEDLNTSKYYETILADILEVDSTGVWDAVYDSWGKAYDGYSNKIVQKVAGAVVDSKKVSTLDFVKNNKEKKVIETIIDYSDGQGVLKDVTIEVDILDKLSVTADLIDNFFEATDELYAYSAVQQEKIDVLKNISSNTKNKSLKSACENLIEDIKFAQENAVLYYVENFGKSTAYDLFEFSSGIVTGLVLQYITKDTAGVNPYIPGLKEAMAIIKAGRLISNSIINADAISKNVLTISAYAEIENEVKNYTTLAETKFISEPTIENARKLISHADFMKATIIHSHDVFIKYVEDVKSSEKNLTIVGNILSILSGDLTAYADAIKGVGSSYDDLIASANRLRNTLSEEDFYSTDFLDVAQYISEIESTTVSEWAKEYIDLAIDTYYIVPDYLQGNYQNNITRAEFCTLLANTLEYHTGNGIEQLVEQSPYTTKLFEDTYYNYVYYMARLGIVNGVSETAFNPLGEITREEAAVMLYRAAKVVGYDVEEYDTSITKPIIDGISIWSTDGVRFVIDKNIMTGTGSGFEPQGKYTKEQAITTFVRFIENL